MSTATNSLPNTAPSAREGVIDLDTGLAYATNPGNLQLELAEITQAPPDPLLETAAT
jgi:hypothetical protein